MNDSKPRATDRARRVRLVLATLSLTCGVGAAWLGPHADASAASGRRGAPDGDAVVTTTSCEPSFAGSWEWHGTITNVSDTRHRFRIDVRYVRGNLRDGLSGTTRAPIAPGRTKNIKMLGAGDLFERGHGTPRCVAHAVVAPR